MPREGGIYCHTADTNQGNPMHCKVADKKMALTRRANGMKLTTTTMKTF